MLGMLMLSNYNVMTFLTNFKLRVPNRYDEFEGYPHWFWAFPSKHLEPITKDFHEKLQKAIEFILS